MQGLFEVGIRGHFAITEGESLSLAYHHKRRYRLWCHAPHCLWADGCFCPCVGTSAQSSSFGDGSTPASPEEENPFASGTSTQSQEFTGANAVPVGAPMLSGPDNEVSQAVQQSAAISLNTTVNSTNPVFGNTQQVVFSSAGNALAPAAASTSFGLVHIEAPDTAPATMEAPAAAPAFLPNAAPAVKPAGAPSMQPNVKTSSQSRKASF